MASEMVERAKAAALVALAEHGSTTDVQDFLVRGDGRGVTPPGALDAMIRAAIEALREPTDAMLNAAREDASKRFLVDPYVHHTVIATCGYTASIDAALEGAG